MFRQRIFQRLKWLGEQVDTVLALFLAAVCSILGLFGVAQSILLTATLGVLTILAFAMLRDRGQREHLRSSLIQLESIVERPGLDDVFKISADDTPITVDAEREIWFVEETGTYSLETKRASIKALLRRGGTVRFVIVKPDEAVLTHLAFRNGISSSRAIKGRTLIFQEHIRNLVDDLGINTEGLQVRFTPYIPDNAFIIVDPSSPVANKRKGIILNLGYHVPFEDRLGTVLQGNTSPKLFSYYANQARQIFEHATKVVLISGPPHSGKTTLIKRLISAASVDNSSHLFSLLFRSMWKGNKQVGYEVITSTNPTPRSLTIRQNGGSHEVNSDVWASVINDLEQAYLIGKIIVIDEIDTPVLIDIKFKDTIEKIINNPSATMFATLSSDDKLNDFQRKMKLHYRTTVVTLQSDTKERAEIEKVLVQELEASLYLTQMFLSKSDNF